MKNRRKEVSSFKKKSSSSVKNQEKSLLQPFWTKRTLKLFLFHKNQQA